VCHCSIYPIFLSKSLHVVCQSYCPLPECHVLRSYLVIFLAFSIYPKLSLAKQMPFSAIGRWCNCDRLIINIANMSVKNAMSTFVGNI
jgi:hypothetical protein